jgi:hypothetical protein
MRPPLFGRAIIGPGIAGALRGPGVVGAIGAGASGGDPIAALFAVAGRTGWRYPLTLDTLFQDAAGTTPVTAPGDPVGLVLDTSKGLAGLSTMYRGLDIAPNYWIDATNGDDGNAGTSEGAAWASLNKITQALLLSGNAVRVRVKAGTYDKATDFVDVTTSAAFSAGTRLDIIFEPGCVVDGTTANGIAATNGFEFSTTSVTSTYIYGNGLSLRNFSEGTAASPNGFGNRANHVLYVYDVDVTNCDDGFSAHGNASMYLYDCTASNCEKSAYAHIENAQTFHYRCQFTGRAGASIGIGVNQSTLVAYFEDCIFVPISAGQTIGANRSEFVRCQLGTASLRLGGTESQNMVATDSFINFARDVNQVMTFTRCYGFASFRQRNGASLTMENCVIVGPASGLSNIFYSNFNPGAGSPHLIRDNIFETSSAAAFMAYDATNAGYVVAAGSEFFNNVLSGSAAFDADLVAADTGGTVIVDNVTADALIGAANTLNPNDYGYAAGSPAIGAGVGGGNSGFAVGEVVAAASQEVRGPAGVPGNHRTQSTALNRPTYQVDDDGKPYLAYNGSNSSMATASFAWGSDKATICVGVRKLSDAVGFGTLLEFSADSNTSNGTFALFAPATAGSASYHWQSRGTTRRQAVYTNAAVAAPVTNVITGLGDISGDRSTLRANSAQVAQDTIDQGSGNYGTNQIFWGARAGTSLFFNGREYPSIGINAALTASELAAVEAWVTARTGALG